MTLTNDAAYTYENSDGSAAAFSRTSSSAAAKPSPAKGKTTSAKRQRVNWSPEVCSYLMSSRLTLGTPSFSQPLSSHFLLLSSRDNGKGGRAPEKDGPGQHHAERSDSVERPGETNTRQDG